MPKVGDAAPEFELMTQDHTKKVKLSDFKGKKKVVLLFYPMDFSPVCTNEHCAFGPELGDMTAGQDAVVFGVSCDPMWSLRIFAEQEKFDYALLSDFWPHGQVSKEYGVFLEEKGFATRGTFVIDKQGVVSWAIVNSPGDVRSTQEYKDAIDKLAA